MNEYRIRPRDILQIQTKPIQYVDNSGLRFHREGDTIIATVNEENLYTIRPNGVRFFKSHTHTLTDNSVLINTINYLEKELSTEGTLDNAVLALPDFLPRYGKIDISTQSYELMCLYCLYQCVIHLVWHLPISNQAAIQHMKECVQPVGNSTENLCWAFISYVNMLLQDQALRILTIVNPPEIKEVLHTESLYNALIYQLFMHIDAGESRVTGSYGVCASCGDSFFRAFKHKKYCERCAQPSERVKACRAKQKKEDHHAQETHP